MVNIVDTWSTWVHRLSCLYNCYTFLVPFVAICFVFYEVDAFSDFLPVNVFLSKNPIILHVPDSQCGQRTLLRHVKDWV